MLIVQDLCKSYLSGGQRQQVFAGLELELAAGEVLALIGASGSGKTTLLNLLSGIDRADRGRIALDGVELSALAEPELTLLRRRRIGFVFQFFNLIPTLRVAENIALPMELLARDPELIEQRTAQLLAQVGLPRMGSRFPETLSGGEQQRVAIARALAHQPQLLLADEPTGNLDEASGEQVISLLTGLAREQGVSMLLVTHSPRVAAIADRCLKLSRGQLESL
jgi:putative ABC transport system ATP-binding protein